MQACNFVFLDGGGSIDSGAFTSCLRGVSKTTEHTESGGSTCTVTVVDVKVHAFTPVTVGRQRQPVTLLRGSACDGLSRPGLYAPLDCGSIKLEQDGVLKDVCVRTYSLLARLCGSSRLSSNNNKIKLINLNEHSEDLRARLYKYANGIMGYASRRNVGYTSQPLKM